MTPASTILATEPATGERHDGLESEEGGSPPSAGTKPLFYLGDPDDGDVEPMKARTLEDAVKEAKKNAQDTAGLRANEDMRTALQDWVVYSVDSKGELCSEEYGIEHVDPKEPKCRVKDGKHRWRKLTVNSYMDGSDIILRACRRCDMKRTVCTWMSDGEGGRYDSVAYEECGVF